MKKLLTIGCIVLVAAIITNCSKDTVVKNDLKSFKSISEAVESGINLDDFISTASEQQKINPQSGENHNLKNGILTYFDDPADFPCTGLPTEDFEEAILPYGTGVVGNPLDENTDNGVFSPGDILPGVLFRTATDHPYDDDIYVPGPLYVGDNESKLIYANYFIDYLIIEFTSNVTSVSMKVFSGYSAGDVNIEVFGASGSLGTTSVWGTNSGTYWGVNSVEPITKITLYSPTDQGEGVDDVAFGTCDSDGDGCPDSEDNFPNSNIEEFVDIDGCSYGVLNRMTLGEPCGTMISDMIDELEEGEYKNHGFFVKAVAQLCEMWVMEGLITQEEMDLIVMCAGESTIGSKK